LQNVRDDNAGGEWRSAGVRQIHFCQHPRTARQEKTSVRSDIFTRKSTEDGLPVFRLSPVRPGALVAVRDWDGETTAIREFGGEFDLSEQRELSVGFGGE